jgi:hypothetical protein
MFKTVAISEPQDAFINCHSKFPRAIAQRTNILILLLVVAAMTTFCEMPAQAQGTPPLPPNHLNVSGNLPAGAVSKAYNAVLAVSGGSSPYYFSVKTGDLPPGISLNRSTGAFSGKPTTAGTYSFEVIVTDTPRFDEGSQTFAVVVADSKPVEDVKVSVSPAGGTVLSKQTQQFTATVSGTSQTGVTWSATAGSVDANGLYTAPAVTAQTSATVTATSHADSAKSASATVTVDAAKNQTLKITTGNLPQGQQGDTYSEVFTATGGTTPYSWSISAGTAPAGIAINANGDLSGTPTAVGTSSFTVTVTDATSQTATGHFSVTVVAGGNFDGPAELPRVTVPTAMADTPAPGSTILVTAGGNLQAALNSANCGQTIALQEGATFTGLFTLPAKACDDQHWIIIRTSAPDTSLPPEGSRISPCYAGVASLPGRPSFNCSTVKNVLSRVTFESSGAGPFILAAGANHYRLLGLEITRTPGTRHVGPLVYTQANPADHFVVDRSWVHGTAQDDTSTGIDLMGMTNAAVIDSFMTDFHCTSRVGTCTDSKAIGGGLGTLTGGPYKIEDNFLEAAGENIIIGGGPATTAPTDIEVLRNHFFKPLIWQKGRPGFVGGPGGDPFVVKNHFELKNAQRVLFEGNILENNWGGFTQWGHSILLTPKNQWSVSQKTSVCPLCQVTDVTIRYSTISHVGSGLSIANVISGHGHGGAAAAGERYSIHDITVDDVDGQAYNGHGNLFVVMNGWPENVLNTVTINHVTGFSDPVHRVLTLLGLPGNPQMWGFVVTNSILGLGSQTITSAGGGPTACAASDLPLRSFDACFRTYTFSHNAIIGSSLAFNPTLWPAGNTFPANATGVKFTNFNNANGGNYQLLPSSPYSNAGSDGKDLGADIGAVQAAISGVY